jgi:hypothetical protein
MTLFIDRKDTQEQTLHCFFAEASTVGLKPGQWPKYLKTNLGNGCSLYRHHYLGDEYGYLYKQNFGCISLTLFND